MLLFAMTRCDAKYFAPKQFYFNRLRDLWDLRLAMAKLAAFFICYYLHTCHRNYPELSLPFFVFLAFLSLTILSYFKANFWCGTANRCEQVHKVSIVTHHN
jgi:hypothetical protein